VTLRFKRKEHLKHRARGVFAKAIGMSIIVGIGAWLVTGGDSVLSRFMQKHTPLVSVTSPQTLAGLPVLNALPKNRLLLWFPGSGYWLKKRMCGQYASVRSVWLERHVESDRIIIHLEPRVPIVTWNGSGFDQDGIVFAITPGTWKAFPQASFLASAKKPELGRWLAKLSAMTELWSQVSSVKENSFETFDLTLKTGTLVIWGSPETETSVHKAQTLLRVLEDAHKNMGGAGVTDLRFFDQGRIIVRPKGVKGV